MRPTDLQFNSTSINAMLDALKEPYEDGDLNSWEQAFYESIRSRIDDNFELTRAQFDKLAAVYKDYCE